MTWAGPDAAEPTRDEAATPSAATTEVSAKPADNVQPVPPDARILALGRHLARDCSSCHRADGVERGIPKITGLSAQQFTAALDAYRNGGRSNPVMGSVAKTLAYYAGLKAQ
jgi:cytochrome c